MTQGDGLTVGGENRPLLRTGPGPWARGPCDHLLLGAVNQLVLVGAFVAGAHPLILPQSLGVLVELLWAGQRGRQGRGRRWAGSGEGPAPTRRPSAFQGLLFWSGMPAAQRMQSWHEVPGGVGYSVNGTSGFVCRI